MAGVPPTRIKGKLLILEVDGVDYVCDLTSVTMLREDAEEGSDVVTFCDASSQSGTTPQAWFFDTVFVASTDPTSFWRYLWDAHDAGTTTGIAYAFAPHGNVAPSDTQPHFTGTLDLTGRPSLGGEANTTWTTEYRLNVVGEPTLVTVAGP
jgi:hypothetical protein